VRLTFGINRLNGPDPRALTQACQDAEAAGFTHLWFPDSQLGGDVYLNLLTAAQRTSDRIHVGALVVNPVTRHPTVTASSIAAVDLYAPGRVLLAIGAGDSAVHHVGLKPARLGTTARAVRLIRSLLAGDGVDLGWREPTRLRHPRPVPVIVAASGPKTLRMAGRLADGAVIRTGGDAELLQRGYEEVCAGAREAGRDPETLFIAGQVHTVLTDDRDEALAYSRSMAAGYYEYNPLIWEQVGLRWPCRPMEELIRLVGSDFHHPRDMKRAASVVAEMPAEVARRFAFAGTAAEIRAQIEQVATKLPWLTHLILHPERYDPALIAAAGSEIIPAFV
jgi:5,10-methylenetetrahydromethanopterin reductase